MDSNSVSQQDMLTVLNVYQQLVTDSSKLAQGDKFLEQALNQINNFASTSIKIFVQKEQNMQMRIYIGALIKNMLREYWQNNKALENQKKEIREILLHGLLMNAGDLRIIEIIALIITEIMVFDGVELWASSLKQIIDWMKSEDLERVNTGLELFCTIFSKVSEKYRNEKILPETFSLTPLIPKLMQALLQILVNLRTLDESQREKLFVLLYLNITSFAYADGSDNRLVAQCFDETFKDWMNLFISTLQTDLKSHITIKRYILKIMNVIFRDFTYYTRNVISTRILNIWKFMNSILPLYIWTCVYGVSLQNLDNNAQPIQDPANILIQQGAQMQDQYGNAGLDNLDFRFLEEEDECLNEIEGLTLNAIELLATLVIKEDLYMLVKHALFPIINALAHFILLSKQQEKLWIHEPNQFISDDEDEANMKSLRALSYNLIFQLIDKFQDQTTQALMIVAEKFMTNQDQAQTVQVIQEFYDKGLGSEIKMGQSIDFNKERLMDFIKTSNFDCNLPDHAWKKREVGLLLLGSFSDDIIDFQFKHTSSFDISSLIQNLISDIQIPNSNPILIAKSLWCVTRFSEVIASKHTELFLPLFKVAMSCLSNTHQFPVRLTAVKSIGVIAHKLKQYEQQLPDRSTWVQYGIEDVSILNDVFDILTYVNVETVHIILDTLVYLNKLSKVYIPEIANLGARSILQIFTLQHNDQMINRITMELITQLSEDPVSFNIVFQNAFSSFILDSFNLIKHHIAENSNLTQIRQQDLSLMASIFDVTSIFVKNCQDNNAKESLIKLLPPLLNLMIVNEESTLQQHASICLKNFIKVADQYIIKNQLVKDVLQVIMKLLQVPSNSQFESNSTYSGNLCMVAFHNLLGGSADPEILKQVIYKIFRSKLATTVQGLVLVWARMIINNPIESVNFLYSFSVENRFALKVLIDKWLLQQAAFRGKYTKNTTLLALTKLFLLKDNRIETLVAIAYNPSHQNVGHDVSAPLKILSTLIRGLDNEMVSQRKEQDYIRDAQNYIKDGEDERLEVDDDENGDYNDQFQEENEGKVEVDMNIIHDEEENQPRIFAVGGEKAGGLAEQENGSTNYMTEGFEFGYDDGEECDETTEEDLEYLKDQYIQVNTAEMLKQFFNDLAKNDPKYFAQCLKHLLKEDINLLQKYINLKNIEQLYSQQIY